MDSDYLDYLARCPSCGRKMEVANQYLRIDQLNSRRTLDRLLYCRQCNIKIRQYVQLT
ncbi:hypothetical protein [Pyrobaculum ferrireducens]|uniref:Uncharacterized protein n=1 Tax=Pyrobaculum ferrireducens TaxID=1104324 RepID=G7VAX0_9CREN|nr:hypothetical protein [Pyrobaculum ferrireducens]AET33548.1 hypothetical protein P186_2156 [Pyrobaculum ferrireducens]